MGSLLESNWPTFIPIRADNGSMSLGTGKMGILGRRLIDKHHEFFVQVNQALWKFRVRVIFVCLKILYNIINEKKSKRGPKKNLCTVQTIYVPSAPNWATDFFKLMDSVYPSKVETGAIRRQPFPSTFLLLVGSRLWASWPWRCFSGVCYYSPWGSKRLCMWGAIPNETCANGIIKFKTNGCEWAIIKISLCSFASISLYI